MASQSKPVPSYASVNILHSQVLEEENEDDSDTDQHRRQPNTIFSKKPKQDQYTFHSSSSEPRSKSTLLPFSIHQTTPSRSRRSSRTRKSRYAHPPPKRQAQNQEEHRLQPLQARPQSAHRHALQAARSSPSHLPIFRSSNTSRATSPLQTRISKWPTPTTSLSTSSTRTRSST